MPDFSARHSYPASQATRSQLLCLRSLLASHDIGSLLKLDCRLASAYFSL